MRKAICSPVTKFFSVVTEATVREFTAVVETGLSEELSQLNTRINTLDMAAFEVMVADGRLTQDDHDDLLDCARKVRRLTRRVGRAVQDDPEGGPVDWEMLNDD